MSNTHDSNSERPIMTEFPVKSLNRKDFAKIVREWLEEGVSKSKVTKSPEFDIGSEKLDVIADTGELFEWRTHKSDSDLVATGFCLISLMIKMIKKHGLLRRY